MKIFRYITALVMAMVAFTACETDPTDMISKDAVAPVMDEHAAILMTPNTLDETVTFTWKAARNLSGTVNYHLYGSLNGQELQLATTQATFFTTEKPALRRMLLDGFGLEGNENFELGIYVEADNGVQALKSESQTVKVYVYGDYKPAVVSVAEGISVEEGLVLTDKIPEEQVLLTWEPAIFEHAQTVTYRVELELGDGFREILADGLEKTEFRTTWPKLNTVLLKKGYEKDKQYELSFLVTAMAAATVDYESEWLESEPVKLKVTTYTPAYPDFLYVIGDFSGHDGMNTLDKAPVLKGDANEGIYHGVVTIYGGKAEFYYINPRTVNDPEPKKIYVGGTTENIGAPYYWTISTNVDGDELAPQDGTYIFYVNLGEAYIHAFAVTSVGLIGEKGLINGIQDDWGKEAQFTFNENTLRYEMSAKFSKSEGQYKVRLNNNWNKPCKELNDGNDVAEPGYNFGQEIGVEHDPTTLVTLAWDQMGENIVSAAGEYNVTIDFSTNANYSLQFEQTAVVNEYGVSGDYNQWGADGKDKKFGADPDQEGWYVVKDFVVTEGQQMIIRMNDSDMSTWGMDAAGQTAEADKTYTLKADGEKFALAAGTYDVFFNPETLEFYATPAGAYYGLCGEHNSWGATADPQFVKAADKDGWLVLKGFSATAGKQAKIRKNDAWAENWGLPGAEIAVGEQYTLEYNVDNFKWAESGVYDIYFNPATLEFYIEAGKEKVYSLYGAFNGSVDWIDFDFTKHERGYYKALNMATTEEFKFLIRADHEWNEKYGASAAVELNTPATLELNGGDIALSAAAGNYDFYFNPATATLYVVAAGSADPTVPVEPVEVLYGLVGQHNGWGPDQPEGTPDPQFVEAVNKEGWLVLKNFEATADNEAKVRTKDAWAQDWGLAGASIAVGEHYTLVAYDGNFKWATTGIYDVYFNPTTLEFYIEEAAGDVYTLVGSMNEWNVTDDTYTFQKNSEGKLELKGVTFATTSDFKVVENYSWDNADYGGALENGVVNLQLDQMVNITIEAGVYDMLLDLDALKLYVTKVADVEPTETVYSLYGAFNNATDWGDTDLTKADNGYYTATNVVVGSDNFEFLIRSNHAWAEKFGKGEVIPIGTATTLVVGGDNMKIAAAGTYDFYFNPTTKVLYILTAGSALPADTKYSLAGSMNGWAAGDQTYTFQNENGKLVLKDMTFSTDGEFKVVTDYSWDNANYGGTLNNGEVALNTAGGNIAIATGIYDMELDIAALKLYVTKVGDPAPVEDVYYLAGTHNGWNGADANSQFTEGANGLMELKNITFGAGGEFKVVKNGSWYGGVLSNGEVMLGSGNNVAIAEGTYDFYLDTTTMKLTVVTAGSAAPSVPETTDTYILAGTHNGWNAADVNSQFAEGASGLLELKNITFGAGGEFKVVKNGTWCGGNLSNGEVMLQLNGGSNVSIAEGSYDFYLDPTTLKLTVVTTGTTPNI
ncbi:MAG: SusE domain-containing protein [Alistipes sp.]|nr:SusE domain-containing protein [Alistipes sp.]